MQEGCKSHKRKAKALLVEERSTTAGMLPAGTLKESLSSSSSFRGSSDQEAASAELKTSFEDHSRMHVVPNQQLDPGNESEFNSLHLCSLKSFVAPQA